MNKRHIEYLTSKFALLASMPGLGRARSELKAGVRSHAVGKYVIYYRYGNGRVTVLHVIHGARDNAKLFE